VSDTTEDKVREGVEHLQNAALEMIAAARIFLDVAEEIVRDPAPFVAKARQHAAPSAASGDDGGVQRIRVV
jgi:hypothetical protein